MLNKNIKTKHMKAMKIFLKTFILSLALVFTSCQDEITELIDPMQDETITASSPLVSLVQRTTARDGSFDNIIDAASCLSIELPVTVVVNGLEIIIDSREDLQVIEDIFEESDFDEDILDIIFPITVITSDHREITIESLAELRELAAECIEGGDDDDIECIDFNYPLTISVFDAENNLIDTLTFQSDEQLYLFFEDLDEDIILSFNFPLTIQLASGLEITVQDHEQLEDLIEAAVEDCDEDDDDDYDDDDCEDCSVERVKELMTACDLSVEALILDGVDQQEQYVDYLFTFVEDGTVEAGIEGSRVEGTWELVETDEGIKLELNIEELPDFDGPWRLHEIEEEEEESIEIEFLRGDDKLAFEKECDGNANDCTEAFVDEALSTCRWRIVSFNGDDNLLPLSIDFSNENIHAFNEAGEIVDEGNWSTSGSEDGVVVSFNDLTMELESVVGEWLVAECAAQRFKMTRGDNFIVLEKECE